MRPTSSMPFVNLMPEALSIILNLSKRTLENVHNLGRLQRHAAETSSTPLPIRMPLVYVTVCNGSMIRPFRFRLQFVIVRLECSFRQPARFDDLLTLSTRVTRLTPAKLEHEYRLTRGGDLIADAKSTLACVNRGGEIQRISEDIMFGGPHAAKGNS